MADDDYGTEIPLDTATPLKELEESGDQPLPNAGDKTPQPDQPTPKVDQPEQPDNPTKSTPDPGESSDPGLPGSPGDPNRPEDSPEPQAKPMISREDAAKKAVEAGIQAVRSSRDRLQRSTEQHEQMLRDMQSQMHEPTEAPPSPVPLDQRPQQERSAYTFLQFALPVALTVAAAIAGRGRGGIAAVSFIGGALQAYSEGRKEDAKEKMKQFDKHQTAIKEDYRERMSEYRATLAEKHYNLSEKMALLRTYAEENKDDRMLHAADARDLNSARAIYNDYLRAHKYVNGQTLRAINAAHALMKDPDSIGYTNELKKRFKAKHGYEATKPDELSDEIDALSFNQWMKSEGRKEDKPAKKGSPAPVATADDPLGLNLEKKNQAHPDDQGTSGGW
jgi:hypothetical protein